MVSLPGKHLYQLTNLGLLLKIDQLGFSFRDSCCIGNTSVVFDEIKDADRRIHNIP